MRTVYFVRHSIRDRAIHDDLSAPLTEQGLQLAEKIEGCIPLDKIEKIFSSPCLRAVQTVEPISVYLNKSITVINDLREREVNDWLIDFDEFTKRQWQDDTFKTKNGESLKEVKERIVPCFEELMKTTKGDILISSHGTLLAVLFSQLTDGEIDYSFFKKMTQPDIYVANVDKEYNVLQLERKLIV